uniref:Uncharacterized protein n=1 Tax=viral metagenome TaxID=1070528 RepID=A0A6M3KFF4_9ZZZZ
MTALNTALEGLGKLTSSDPSTAFIDPLLGWGSKWIMKEMKKDKIKEEEEAAEQKRSLASANQEQAERDRLFLQTYKDLAAKSETVEEAPKKRRSTQTLFTGGQGLLGQSPVVRKTLLGE